MKEFVIKKCVVVESVVYVLASDEKEAQDLVNSHVKHISKIEPSSRLTMRILSSKEILDVTPKL